MNARETIAEFATGTYAVSRKIAGTFVDGIAVPAVATTVQIVASVQSPVGRDLDLVPEDRRSNESRVVFTADPLYTGGEAAAFEADHVSIDGVDFEVHRCEVWRQPNGDDPFYRAIVVADK